jgi:hypothetical protein
VYLDVPQPGEGCATIIKSPAGTDVVGCGTTIGAYKQATCSVQELKTTFMVQFCCGSGDCEKAGGLKRGHPHQIRGDSSFSGGVILKDKNGKEMTPLEVGQPINTRSVMDKLLDKRVSCSSWTADGMGGRDGYTRPGDDVRKSQTFFFSFHA